VAFKQPTRTFDVDHPLVGGSRSESRQGQERHLRKGSCRSFPMSRTPHRALAHALLRPPERLSLIKASTVAAARRSPCRSTAATKPPLNLYHRFTATPCPNRYSPMTQTLWAVLAEPMKRWRRSGPKPLPKQCRHCPWRLAGPAPPRVRMSAATLPRTPLPHTR